MWDIPGQDIEKCPQLYEGEIGVIVITIFHSITPSYAWGPKTLERFFRSVRTAHSLTTMGAFKRFFGDGAFIVLVVWVGVYLSQSAKYNKRYRYDR